MANAINTIVCASSKANTGRGPCAAPDAPTVWKIAGPKGWTLSEADLVDPAATFKTKLVADSRATRLFAIGPLTDVDPQIVETVFTTSGNGSRFVAKEATVNFSYEMMGATNCDQKMLLGFDNSQRSYDFMDFRANEWLVGQKRVSSTLPNAVSIGGYKPQLVYVPMRTAPTYAAVSNAYIQFNHLNPKIEQGNEAAVNLSGLDLDTIFREYAVQTVEFTLAATLTTTGVIPIYAIAGCGQNMGLTENYGGTLTAACFKAVNGNTGATLAITSISVNSTTGAITITLTTPPAAGVPILLSLQAVSTVFGVLGGYFEVVTPLRVLNIA